MRFRLALVAALAFGVLASRPAPAANGGESAVGTQLTVYGAKWCGACKVLEAGLRERGIPFDTVDVDQNPGAYAIARKASGTNAIPLTHVVRGPAQRWIVGADVEAVVRAYNGE